MNVNYSNDSWTNQSENKDDIVYTESFNGAQIVLVVLYTAVSLTSITGNGAVCYVVFSTRRMRTVTNYFISSLAISDILMATLCIPFTFVANVLLDHWPFGGALCPVVTYLQAVVVFQNAYTFLAISLERYVAIMYPFKPRLPKRKAFWVILLCWLLSFLTPLPTAITSTTVPLDGDGANWTSMFLCVEVWPSYQQKFAYSVTIMVLQYFVPLGVLVFTYSRVVHVVWLKDVQRAETEESDPKKKVIKMMITVVGIYAVCWLPLHVITICGDVNNDIYNADYMRVVWTCSHWLAMSSCSYNPFVYWWMNTKFREGFMGILVNLKSSCVRGDKDSRRQIAMYSNSRSAYSMHMSETLLSTLQSPDGKTLENDHIAS